MIRALAFCLLAAPALAQAPAAIDTGLVQACFLEGDGPAAPCIGAAATLCMERTDGGTTTTGMTDCLAAETSAWDGLLNSTYQAFRADLDVADEAPGPADRIDRTEALRDAQRAWIAYRDAECRLHRALSQDGTLRGIVAGRCRMENTARRTLELRNLASPEGRR